MKFYSWNVNGIRAVVKKGTFQKFVAEHKPDILCLQETKAEKGQAEIDPQTGRQTEGQFESLVRFELTLPR